MFPHAVVVRLGVIVCLCPLVTGCAGGKPEPPPGSAEPVPIRTAVSEDRDVRDRFVKSAGDPESYRELEIIDHCAALERDGGLTLRGFLTCSNHRPAHAVRTFAEAKEKSKDPPACSGWMLTGRMEAR